MIRNPRDFYAGLLFVAFGVVALVIVQSYAIGTAARMGPGYFPRLLGILLVGGGIIQALIGLRSKSEIAVEWHWRPLLMLLIGVALFIVMTPWLGLIVATLVTSLVAMAASRDFRWQEALPVGAILGGAAAAVFVYGLGIPLPVWPWFMGR
ncbi:MAG: tripartite tricarboxylate transporter TctB family protein [Pseudolabrys sp.]|nr:tripartite tricarboxylate transporter TctB family protein [Pseudolabrys sp.]MDP2295056.1 tripartite tricarboxylate transporter TctB family protein [Pseudolabrys sp.]